MALTETNEMPVHELASVVRMERDDSPWIPTETGLQRSYDIHLCFRPNRSCLRPSRRTVGDGQGPVEISHGLSSIMTHQVHGQSTGDIQGRIHTGLDGDPATQRSTPGMRDPMQEIALPFPGKESPNRGRTHLEEQLPGLFINAKMSMSSEVLHKEGHACCQTDRSQEGTGTPDGDECLLNKRAISGRTVSLDVLAGISHEDTVSQQVALSCLMQDTGCISPAVPRGFTKIIQHDCLLCFACLDVPLCFYHCQLLPFSHRELHFRCSFLVPRTSSILFSFAYFFS